MKFRSAGDDKFNPFPSQVVNMLKLSRSPQVCEVFKLMQDRSDLLSDANEGPRINNLICSVAGSGAGKTYFLDCLLQWNKYKEDILKSLNPSSQIHDMVENENLQL